MRRGGINSVSRKRLSYYWRKLRKVKTWQLAIILLIVSILTVTFLRSNNLEMIERRDAVIAADKKGNKTAISNALVELQHYVSSHMNTSLGNGVYLETTYNADREAALSRAGDAQNPNATAYQRAAIACQSRFDGGAASFRNDYVQCVVDRVNDLEDGTDALENLQLPRADAYRYNFTSPRISFDLAGLFVLLALFITGVIILRLVTLSVLYLLLKRRASDT